MHCGKKDKEEPNFTPEVQGRFHREDVLWAESWKIGNCQADKQVREYQKHTNKKHCKDAE